jgi:hypothetical protein
MSNEPNLGIFREYEDGKHRRYSLLFSVNGGAFAIAQFLAKCPPDGKTVGHLSLAQLAWGLCLFTIVMTYDIYTFGNKMRGIQEPERKAGSALPPEVFARRGKAVLLFIGALICAGWFRAGIY